MRTDHHPRKLAVALALALALAGAAGCGGDDEPTTEGATEPTSTNGPGGTDAVETTVEPDDEADDEATDSDELPDPCDVLTLEYATELVGAPVELDTDSTGTFESVQCKYGVPNPTSESFDVASLILFTLSDRTVEDAFAETAAAGLTVTPVPEIGDGAILVEYEGGYPAVYVDLGDGVHYIDAAVLRAADYEASVQLSIELAQRYLDSR